MLIRVPIRGFYGFNLAKKLYLKKVIRCLKTVANDELSWVMIALKKLKRLECFAFQGSITENRF